MKCETGRGAGNQSAPLRWSRTDPGPVPPRGGAGRERYGFVGAGVGATVGTSGAVGRLSRTIRRASLTFT
jgi:hypothetical protein